MKLKAFILTLLAAVMLFSSCAAKKDTDIPDGMQLLSNKYVDYTAYVPEEWKVNEPTATPYAYVGTQDASSVNIVAQSYTNEQAEAGLEGYWKSYSKDFKKTLSDFDCQSKPTEILLDGVAAHQYVYTATLSGIEYKYQQTICMHEGYVYIITYTSTPELYDEHTDEVKKIIKTFKFD